MKKPDIYIVGININKQYAYSLSKEADPADRYVRVVHGIYFRESIPAEQLFETYGFRITRQLLANAALTHSTAWYKRPTDGRIFVGGAYPYHRTVGDKVGDFAIVQSMIAQRSNQLLMDISSNMKAIISQRLVRTQDGKGRRAAVEILLNTPLIAENILKGHFHNLKEIMTKSRELGMQTFDQALFDLYNEGAISYDEALRNADSVNELRLQIKLKGNRPETSVVMTPQNMVKEETERQQES